jgi:hypothetical protein
LSASRFLFVSSRRQLKLPRKVHKGLLYVAGGDTGDAYVYDTRSGDSVRLYSFNPGGVCQRRCRHEGRRVVHRLVLPVPLQVPITRDGTPGDPSAVEAIPLTGDIVYEEGFNVNGIDATPNGKKLVIVQSNTGTLFTVDPSSGVTSEIDLGAENVESGDGILLDGRTSSWSRTS